jgi:hypothetical protein
MDLTSAAWRKSSYSGGNGGNCVEVARNLPDIVAVRDSKDRPGVVLTLARSGWADFVAGIKSGELDLR